MSNIIAVLGTTACGKTRMAVRLAALIDGEIISADSRQVYQKMDIGTGKDIEEYSLENQSIKYHLIDIVPAGTHYNVFEYQKHFFTAYHDIISRQKIPILCGGSGMYIEAVMQNYQLDYVPLNHKFRAEIENLDNKNLTEMLQNLKPLHNTSDVADRQRLIRALEIATYQQNTTLTSENSNRLIQTQIYYLYYDNETVRQRIADRLKQRFSQGMLEEVQNLISGGMKPEELIYYGLEYKYITLHLTGKLSYNDMENQLFTAICQFAKRQRTWFRKMQRNGFIFNVIDCQEGEERALNKILTHIQTAC